MFQIIRSRKKIKNVSEEILLSRIQEYYNEKKYLVLTGEDCKIVKKLIKRNIIAENAFEENFILEGGRSLILFPDVNPFSVVKNEN